MTRSRWGFALAVVAALAFGGAALGGTAIASATPPVPLGDSRVVDGADVLTPTQESAVNDHLVAVSDAADLDLWVVYVDHFTNPSNAEDWANQVAYDNSLGPDQYVLAVATEGGAFYLSGDPQYGPVSDAKLGDIEDTRIGPRLSAGDWAGAATAAADGLAAAVGVSMGGSSDGGSGAPGIGGILLIVLAIAVVGVIVWLVVRSRRKAAPAPAGEVPLEELAKQAASALVQTDDAVKTSEQELGFATAQFGDAATAEFTRVLGEAKTGLDEAFHLKQQLDDDEPDTPEQTRAWNTRILELCTAANAALDAKAAEFDELRKLEQNAPEALARVQERRIAVAGDPADVAQRLAGLRATYAPDELASIADNPEQAAQRLAFADESLATAEHAIGAGDGAAAAVSIRAAEVAVAQVRALKDAVASRADELARAESGARALIADLEGDFVAAAGLPDADGGLAAIIAAARQTVDAAKAHLGGGQRRPLATLEQLERANADVDARIAHVRGVEEQRRRAAQQLEQVIMQAQGQVTAAEDFVAARRGAVGATARTRLAEAGSTLVHARQLAASDPQQAVQLAQRANELARQAMQHAQRDVSTFSSGGGGSDLGGAILGGILVNSLLGGGSRGSSVPRSGGFGGGSRSSGGFGGSRSGGSRSSGGSRGGSFSAGSFGGSGTRSRRGGGRF
ncbi:TPM domain-containing protein [Microbacterium sp. No. 7]|uniref:TPM domain-containing protein n=1 Tax=Microbacterium sp. No. 7 TaxID=1714373 RepID=UPI000AB3A288|nr:TPM domain-containing protein [Microbacterium sp. No. 7]